MRQSPRKTHIAALTLAIALFFTLLASCSSRPTSRRLVVYISKSYGMLETVVETYKTFHPWVALTVRELENDEFADVLAADLMGGKGPDLIVSESYLFDFEKYMRNNAFCDINELLENSDSDLAWMVERDRLNNSALDAGVFNEKRLAMPITYHVPIVLTSEAALARAGVRKTQLENFNDFMTVAAQLSKNSPSPEDVLTSSMGSPGAGFYDFLMIGGLSLYDWETGRSSVKSNEFRAFMERYKGIYSARKGNTGRQDGGALREFSLTETMYFKSMLNSGFNSAFSNLCLQSEGERPVMLSNLNERGGLTGYVGICASIPINARNKQGAIDFLTYFYDDQYHINRNTAYNELPVSNKLFVKQMSEANSSLTRRAGDYEAAGLFYNSAEDLRKSYVQAVTYLADCKFSYLPGDELIQSFLANYWEGEITLEKCLEKLDLRISLYAEG